MNGYDYATLSDAELCHCMRRVNSLLQSSNTVPEEVVELKRQREHMRWELAQRMDDNTERFRRLAAADASREVQASHV